MEYEKTKVTLIVIGLIIGLVIAFIAKVKSEENGKSDEWFDDDGFI